MNIYRLSQSEKGGYDTYDFCVVVAPDEAAARATHPDCGIQWNGQKWVFEDSRNADTSTWASHPDNVTAEHIGTALEGVTAGVICASFNAG